MKPILVLLVLSLVSAGTAAVPTASAIIIECDFDKDQEINLAEALACWAGNTALHLALSLVKCATQQESDFCPLP